MNIRMMMPRRRFLLALLVAAAAVWPVLSAIDWFYREEENYSIIEQGLYMGAYTENPPPGVPC